MADTAEKSDFSRDQLARLCDRYEELVEATTIANNGMLDEMSRCPDLGDRALAILNKWSLCINEIHAVWAERTIVAIEGRRERRSIN